MIAKLLFFICYRGDKILQEGVVRSLEKLGQTHDYSLKILKDLVDKYGEKEHKISKTTINNEVKNYKSLQALISK